MWAGAYDHSRTDQQIAGAIVSAGTFSGYIGPVPQGYCWYVERETCYSNTAAATTATLLEIFVSANQTGPTSPDKTGRQDLTVQVTNDISDNNCPIYVGEGMYLVAQWSGLSSGDKVAYSTQIRVHKLLHAKAGGQGRHEVHDTVSEEKAGDGLASPRGDTFYPVPSELIDAEA